MKRITHILCFIALCLSWTACTKDEAVEPQQLPAPVVRLVERPGTEALLEWADVSGAMSYCYYLTDGGGGEVIAETGTAETSVRLTGLEESKTYVFFVKAVGGDGYTDSEYAQCMVETMRVEVLSIASDRAVIEIVPTVSTEIYCWAMIPALQADGLDDDALISLLQQSHGVELTDLWSMGSKTHVCAGLEPSTEYTLAVFMWSPTLEQPASGIVRRHITTLDKQISFTRAVEHYLGPAEDGMHDVYRIMLFNEGVEKGWCQFLERSVLFDQLHKAVNVNGLICLLGDLLGKLPDSSFQPFLLGLITSRQLCKAFLSQLAFDFIFVKVLDDIIQFVVPALAVFQFPLHFCQRPFLFPHGTGYQHRDKFPFMFGSKVRYPAEILRYQLFQVLYADMVGSAGIHPLTISGAGVILIAFLEAGAAMMVHFGAAVCTEQ